MSSDVQYKIKVQRGDLLVEIEGDKEFVEEKYRDWQEQLQQSVEKKVEQSASGAPKGMERPNSSRRTAKPGKSSGSGKRATETPSLIDHINIDKADLKALFDSKKPSGHEELFLFFACYLKEKHEVAEVGTDEIFTCYRTLGVRGPGAWQQKFRDAKSRKSWFNRGSETGKYAVSGVGENYYLHDMPSANTPKEAMK